MPPGARQVTLGGLLRGRELEGAAMIALDPDNVLFDTARGRMSIALAQLDGVRLLGDVLELYLANGDVIELSGSAELQALATEISNRACAIPEMTRSLRALGVGTHAAGEEQDRFFGPLLEAKLLAERAPNLMALRAAFDAEALRASIVHEIEDIAADRYPSVASERRSLAAEIAERAQPLFVRMDTLAQAEAIVGACDDSERFVRWREWSAALRDVFRSADSSWITIHPLLTAERRSPPSFWRRMFGRKKARRRSAAKAGRK